MTILFTFLFVKKAFLIIYKTRNTPVSTYLKASDHLLGNTLVFYIVMRFLKPLQQEPSHC
jgi:hypothetical protein